eukprot:TRINITY_DN6626_c0_g2_i2.p1 TRINITY_DN6626_c0_g2~~TRINITY_DN6626_c0_g2_i2.p1  ORF type:complete len:302 (-),score=77.23 TRINITY_DN6626_c0_g2_i2:79-984(-)
MSDSIFQLIARFETEGNNNPQEIAKKVQLRAASTPRASLTRSSSFLGFNDNVKGYKEMYMEEKELRERKENKLEAAKKEYEILERTIGTLKTEIHSWKMNFKRSSVTENTIKANIEQKQEEKSELEEKIMDFKEGVTPLSESNRIYITKDGVIELISRLVDFQNQVVEETKKTESLKATLREYEQKAEEWKNWPPENPNTNDSHHNRRSNMNRKLSNQNIRRSRGSTSTKRENLRKSFSGVQLAGRKKNRKKKSRASVELHALPEHISLSISEGKTTAIGTDERRRRKKKSKHRKKKDDSL